MTTMPMVTIAAGPAGGGAMMHPKRLDILDPLQEIGAPIGIISPCVIGAARVGSAPYDPSEVEGVEEGTVVSPLCFAARRSRAECLVTVYRSM